VRAGFSFIPGVPVLAVSALDGRNIRKILEMARLVAQSRSTRVATAALNRVLRTAVDEHPPRYHKGRRLALLYAAQADTPAPTFVLFVNDPELLHFSYKRYLENRLRAVFGFAGVPVRLLARARAEEG
jgi:GTP-binding protein